MSPTGRDSLTVILKYLRSWPWRRWFEAIGKQHHRAVAGSPWVVTIARAAQVIVALSVQRSGFHFIHPGASPPAQPLWDALRLPMPPAPPLILCLSGVSALRHSASSRRLQKCTWLLRPVKTRCVCKHGVRVLPRDPRDR